MRTLIVFFFPPFPSFPYSFSCFIYSVFLRAMSDSLLHFFSHIQRLLRFLYHPQTIHHFFIFRSRLFFFFIPFSTQAPFSFSLEYTSLLFFYFPVLSELCGISLSLSPSLFSCLISPPADLHPSSLADSLLAYQLLTSFSFFFFLIFPCLSFCVCVCVCVCVYYSLFSCQAPSSLYRITTNTQKKRRRKKEAASFSSLRLLLCFTQVHTIRNQQPPLPPHRSLNRHVLP